MCQNTKNAEYTTTETIDVCNHQQESKEMIVLTNTGRRGWQARLTIGFLRSVFIFVGGLPPSTVPTTRRHQKALQLTHTGENFKIKSTGGPL